MTAGDIYRALWRHKLLIGVLTLLTVGATWFLTVRQTEIYQASTVVRIQQPARSSGQSIEALDVGQRLAQTYSNILNTSEIAGRVRTELGGDVPLSAIKGKISASPVQELDLVVISARSPSPREAQRIANAVPPALNAFVRETSPRAGAVLTLDAARVPSEPESPNLALNLAVAFLLGLMLNGALALLFEILSDRLPDPDELGTVIGQPVLATLPRLSFARISAMNGAGSRQLGEELLDSLAHSTPDGGRSGPEEYRA